MTPGEARPFGIAPVFQRPSLETEAPTETELLRAELASRIEEAKEKFPLTPTKILTDELKAEIEKERTIMKTEEREAAANAAFINRLKQDGSVVSKRNGVDQYGFYMEILSWKPNSPTEYRFVRQTKLFMAGRMVIRYRRSAGKKSARWHLATFPTRTDAEEKFARYVEDEETLHGRHTLRGSPMAIQLTEADVIAIKQGKAPYARFVGSLQNDRAMGVFEDTEKLTVDLSDVTA